MRGQRHAPAALPLGKNRYLLYRRLGGPQGRSGQVRKISPQPGFDPRTVQPVASRYTDYPAHTYCILGGKSVPCITQYINKSQTDCTDSKPKASGCEEQKYFQKGDVTTNLVILCSKVDSHGTVTTKHFTAANKGHVRDTRC